MPRTRRRTILVLHGPNLNLLGIRAPDLYGSTTLEQIDGELARRAATRGADVESFQSNVEGELVTRIHEARGGADAILINAGAYTHTSIAIRDALDAIGLPTVEVHLTNIHKREPFRRTSMIADACVGMVCGFGATSYYVALEAVLDHINVARARRA